MNETLIQNYRRFILYRNSLDIDIDIDILEELGRENNFIFLSFYRLLYLIARLSKPRCTPHDAGTDNQELKL